MASHAPTFGAEWSASLLRGSAAEAESWLEFARSCADAADEIALRHFRRDLQIQAKPDHTYVTQADREVEELIRGRIADSFPGHGIVGEEYGTEAADAEFRWYVDPIDGTHNYMRGIPLFGTLLALERDGEIQIGVASAPAIGQRWHARRGGGTWVVGGPANPPEPRRLRVSAIDRLDEAQVLFRSLTDMEASRVPAGFHRVIRSAWRERGFGDFWGYTLVADGVAEVMLEQGLHPWDLAAPSILVEEAGGRITDFDGRRSFDRGEGFASNGLLHEAVLEALTEPEPA